jgi:imidazolonepropionase-like amidohydrolase
MQIRLRLLDGSSVQLGVAGGRFTGPDPHDRDLIDCSKGYALPGLVDAHAHLQAGGVDEMVSAGAPDPAKLADNARAQVAGGVLLIADKGSKSDVTLDFLHTVPNDRPELHMAGEILVVEGGYYPGFGRVIDPDEAGAHAARAAATAASWVKFIGDWPRRGLGSIENFTRDQFAVAVAAAHAGGARVAVHTMGRNTPSNAVAAGVDSIEHGLFLTRDDLMSLGDRRGAWVPTVVAMEAVAATLRRGSSGRRLINEGLENVRALLPGAVAAGVHVLAGTDLALPHGAVAREAVRLVEYGMTPEEVVSSTIFGGYDYLGTTRGFTPGDRADVVCVPGDPREVPSVLLEPMLIMRLGRVVARRS